MNESRLIAYVLHAYGKYHWFASGLPRILFGILCNGMQRKYNEASKQQHGRRLPIEISSASHIVTITLVSLSTKNVQSKPQGLLVLRIRDAMQIQTVYQTNKRKRTMSERNSSDLTFTCQPFPWTHFPLAQNKQMTALAFLSRFAFVYPLCFAISNWYLVPNDRVQQIVETEQSRVMFTFQFSFTLMIIA